MRRGSPLQKNKKYQKSKFDSFGFLIISILKKISTHRPTDRPTDQQTFGLIEATCRAYHSDSGMGIPVQMGGDQRDICDNIKNKCRP